jgi:hypothetical protein
MYEVSFQIVTSVSQANWPFLYDLFGDCTAGFSLSPGIDEASRLNEGSNRSTAPGQVDRSFEPDTSLDLFLKMTEDADGLAAAGGGPSDWKPSWYRPCFCASSSRGCTNAVWISEGRFSTLFCKYIVYFNASSLYFAANLSFCVI